MNLIERQKRQLFELFARGPLSRTALVEALGIRRNTVYDDVASFLDQRLIREVPPKSCTVGRPRTPLQIDPDARHVIGVSFQRGQIEAGRFNLLGQPLGESVVRRVTAKSAVRVATQLLRNLRNKSTVALGVSTPGFIDRKTQEIVFSILFPGSPPISLKPIYDAAHGLLTVIESEANTIAARWLLTHALAPIEDTLLIYFDDGSLGAALIVHGRPNRGCISGANELGHTRLHVKTEQCYCGGIGCLERVCDTTDLRIHGLRTDFSETLTDNLLDQPAMERMIDLLAIGFANAVNFTRASHVIIASQLPHSASLLDRLITATTRHVLPQLRQRVRFDPWPEADARSAHTAAHLALAGCYFEAW